VFHLSGGRLCLDFANTVSWRASDRPIERLESYADLLAWSRQAGVVTAGEARTLASAGRRRPAEARRVLGQAIGLREAIYRAFTRIAEGPGPTPADLAALNAGLAEALARRRVMGRGRRFSFGWTTPEAGLDRMLGPVMQSVAELLVGEELSHLRTCASPTCGWVFLDTTRNRSRRWCDMRVCGNRAKVRRHYRRRGARRGAPRGQAPSPR
jgi:predicted RNA-binding Zn ribbon-like protein